MLAVVGLADLLFLFHDQLLEIWTEFPGMKEEVCGDFRTKILEILYGMIPGGVLLTAGFLARQHVGPGDGCGLMSLGIVCGLQCTLAILSYSSMCIGIAATVLVLRKKTSKNISLPHLLYMFLGYIIVLLLMMLTGIAWNEM